MKFSKGNMEIIKLDENNSFYSDIYKTNSARVSFYLFRQCSANLVSEMMRVRITSKLGSTHSWVSVIVKMDTLPRKGEPRYRIG